MKTNKPAVTLSATSVGLTRQCDPLYSTNKALSLRKAASVSLLLALSVAVSRGASVSLTASDPGGTSSMISAGKWNDGNPPSPANDYFTGAFFVRTPTDPTGSPAGLVYTFPGNSLTLQQPTGQGAPM